MSVSIKLALYNNKICLIVYQGGRGHWTVNNTHLKFWGFVGTNYKC